MSACKYLATRLSGMLLDPSVKAVSPGALEQFNLDIIQCEQFAAQCPVSGFEEGTLLMTFAELRQVLDLLMAGDWTTYVAEYGHSERYSRVQPKQAEDLLEKLIEFEKKRSSGIFARGGTASRDKRKLLETVLKQLRTLRASD